MAQDSKKKKRERRLRRATSVERVIRKKQDADYKKFAQEANERISELQASVSKANAFLRAIVSETAPIYLTLEDLYMADYDQRTVNMVKVPHPTDGESDLFRIDFELQEGEQSAESNA